MKKIILLAGVFMANFMVVNDTFAAGQQMNCSLNITNSGGRVKFKQLNNPRILGITEAKYDLQPIFDDQKLIDILGGEVRFMANLFVDKATGNLKLLLGIYRMQKAFKKENESEEYWSPKGNSKFKAWYAKPEVELVSDPDSAEIISGVLFGSNDVKFSCGVAI